MNAWTDLWTVKLGDWGRGLVIAIITAPLTILYQSLTATPVALVFDWKAIIGAALAGGVGYLVKNLATGPSGKLLSNK
jgi:hypothetical protein